MIEREASGDLDDIKQPLLVFGTNIFKLVYKLFNTTGFVYLFMSWLGLACSI